MAESSSHKKDKDSSSDRRRSLRHSKGHPVFTPRYQPPISSLNNHLQLNSSGESTGGSTEGSLSLLEPPSCSSFNSSCSSLEAEAVEEEEEEELEEDQDEEDPPSSPSISPYLNLLDAVDNDPKWLEERGRGKVIGLYKVHGEIGIGNFARVRLGVHLLLKERVAVKIIEKGKTTFTTTTPNDEGKLEKMMTREVSTLLSLQHPNILRLYEVIETPWKLYLISEWAPAGDLHGKVTLRGRLMEREARPIFLQILGALMFMHGQDIVHRDLKAENVFFSSATHCKLGDFGFATIYNRGQLLSTFCGSPPYAAPELFRDQAYEGPPVDVWALGILLYFMVEGGLPFMAPTIPALKSLILSGHYFLSPSSSSDLSNLLSAILVQKPSSRLTLSSILRHSWLSGKGLGGKALIQRQDTTTLLSPATRNRAFSTSIPTPQQVAQPGLLSKQEYEALGMLKRLGIPNEEIEDARGKGVKSKVGGIYRIFLHKLQQGQKINEAVFTVEQGKNKGSPGSGTATPNSTIQYLLAPPGIGGMGMIPHSQSCSFDEAKNNNNCSGTSTSSQNSLGLKKVSSHRSLDDGKSSRVKRKTALLTKQVACEVPQSTTCVIL